jgi:hypothetical protein
VDVPDVAMDALVVVDAVGLVPPHVLVVVLDVLIVLVVVLDVLIVLVVAVVAVAQVLAQDIVIMLVLQVVLHQR